MKYYVFCLCDNLSTLDKISLFINLLRFEQRGETNTTHLVKVHASSFSQVDDYDIDTAGSGFHTNLLFN